MVIKTESEARAFLSRMADHRGSDEPAHPCCYGHPDCSDSDGGPCLDETLTNFPALADQY
jgi:hypothetical protein